MPEKEEIEVFEAQGWVHCSRPDAFAALQKGTRVFSASLDELDKFVLKSGFQGEFGRVDRYHFFTPGPKS